MTDNAPCDNTFDYATGYGQGAVDAMADICDPLRIENFALRCVLGRIAVLPYWEGVKMIEIARQALREADTAVPIPPIDVSKVPF